MPPYIALIVCILFIFIIFGVDLKKKSDVSSALWIPLIWVLVLGSRPVSTWLMTERIIATETDPTAGNPIDRTILSILIIIGIVILSRRKIEWSQMVKRNTWILTLFIFMGLSILWSDFPAVSSRRLIRTIGNLIMVLVVLTDPDAVEAIKTMFRRCAYVLIPLSVIFIKYFRHLGVAYSGSGEAEMWIGVTTHKNSLGKLCLFCGFFFLWHIWTVSKKKEISIKEKVLFIDILFLLMTLWILNGSPTSESMTSYIAFIIGIFVLITLKTLRSNPQYIGRYLFLITFTFLFLHFVLDLIFPFYEMIVTSSGRDTTLTGRTDLWSELIAIGSRHPILGVGYGSFWIGDLTHNLWEKFVWMPESGHNGYIDVWLELGLVGLFFLIGVIVSAYRDIKQTLLHDFEFGRFQMALLAMIVFCNFTESSFTKAYSLTWFIFLLISVYIPKKIQNNNQKIRTKGI